MPTVPHYLRDFLSYEDIYEALVTGTRPVYFQEATNTLIWGSGTLFVAQWKQYQFAITAKHVITNCDADPKHMRLIFPGYEVALPFQGAYTPNFPGYECQEDLEDIFVLRIDHKSELDGEPLEWFAWKMDIFWKPASQLTVGQQVFVVGFPSMNNRYDWENNKIKETPMVAIGKVSEKTYGAGIFTVDCAEFAHDISGTSGGPVFARFDGIFHYVGMAIRGGSEAKKIHFIDSSFITFVLDQASKQL